MAAGRLSAVVYANPGDNLFRLAAVYLGDATQWNRIAQLNIDLLGGVADPFIQPGSVLALRMPPVRKGAGNGGIYGV